MTVSDEYRQQLLNQLKGTGVEIPANQSEMQELAGDDAKISSLIETLRDQSSSATAKKSALNKLNVVSVFSPVLPRKMPEYVNALRGLLDSEDTEVRTQAFGTLASMKDEVAQERLQTELQSSEPEQERKIPTHQAIGMLGFDEKALDYGVLRKIVANPPTEKSLVAAIRHLPADPSSYDVLKKVMEDDSQPLEARALVPDMINNVNPRDFLESVGKKLKEKGAQYDLAPYLARGIGGIDTETVNSALEAPPGDARESTESLTAEIEKTKSLFKELLPNSPEPFQKAANEYLFSEKDHGE